MANATAAGPSYGLFDVLFGKGPKEEPGDGQEFGPLMDIIKALNKGKEELAQGGRTDKGTAVGLGQGESPAMKSPTDHAISAEQSELPNQIDADMRDKEMRERMAALYGIAMIPAAPAVTKMAPGEQPELSPRMSKLDAKDVNRALKEKSLPGLTDSEQKLLEEVNSKLEQVNVEQSTAALLAKLEKKKDAPAKEEATESALGKELAAKGIDPREVKSGEAQGVPEKIVTTDSYLKLHESFGKAAAKDGANAKRSPSAIDEAKPQTGSAQQSLVQNAVDEAGGKGKGSTPDQDMLGKQSLGKLEGGKGSKAGNAGSAAFAEMMQSIKGEGSSTSETKNVFLSGAKPEQMRSTILGEVQQGVNVQALKGGGEMRLVVHPPELGEVHLKVGTKEGKVEVSITAESNKVADMIRGGSKELEHSLQDKNLTLSKFEVSVSDQLTVASSDNKSNMTDQFLSQNQNGFTQSGMGREDRSSARHEGGFNQGQESKFGSFMNEPARNASANRMKDKALATSRSSSGRLDVVA
ncbi:MAG: flagellar hook-length control protein FliK [Bdellovibrionota bacterium]